MRRSALAVALLLATAPVARATEVTPATGPELRVVEVAAPSIRKDVVVAPARAEARSTKAAAVERVGAGRLLIIVALATFILFYLSLPLLMG